MEAGRRFSSMPRMRFKKGAALLAVAVLLTAGAGRAQTPAQGAAGPAKGEEEHLRLLQKHLAALNAGDAEALKKFAAEHLSEQGRRGQPPERIAQRELGLHRDV